METTNSHQAEGVGGANRVLRVLCLHSALRCIALQPPCIPLQACALAPDVPATVARQSAPRAVLIDRWA